MFKEVQKIKLSTYDKSNQKKVFWSKEKRMTLQIGTQSKWLRGY